MAQVFITKKQLEHLFETGSNSAAMDLDRYVQPVSHDTSNGNDDLIDVCDGIEDMIKELRSSLNTGLKLKQSDKNVLFKLNDMTSSLLFSSTEMK